MVSLNIRVSGVPVVQRDLARMRDRIGDLRPAMDRVALLLSEANAANFDSEGAAGAYGHWAPLSPKYRAWKEKHYPGKPILVRTGALRESLVSVPMGVQSSTATSITLGSDVSYGGFHQTGTARMPRRAPIALTEQTKRDMTKILQRFVVYGDTTGSF